MKVSNTNLADLVVLEPDVFRDHRGFFVESYHRQRFKSGVAGDEEFVQDNHSRSQRGVLRGLHYQDMRAPMGKLVRCTLGAVWDVAVDLRVGSPTFGQWAGMELDDRDMKQVWVPVGFAHGFVVLSETADIQYKCSGYYSPESERGLIWDDPDLAIGWPVEKPILSDKDRSAETFRDYQKKPAFRYAENRDQHDGALPAEPATSEAR